MHGIAPKMIRQNPPRALATSQGHLKLIRQQKRRLQTTPRPQTERTSNTINAYATNTFAVTDIAGGALSTVSFTGDKYVPINNKNYIHFHPVHRLTTQ